MPGPLSPPLSATRGEESPVPWRLGGLALRGEPVGDARKLPEVLRPPPHAVGASVSASARALARASRRAARAATRSSSAATSLSTGLVGCTALSPVRVSWGVLKSETWADEVGVPSRACTPARVDTSWTVTGSAGRRSEAPTVMARWWSSTAPRGAWRRLSTPVTLVCRGAVGGGAPGPGALAPVPSEPSPAWPRSSPAALEAGPS